MTTELIQLTNQPKTAADVATVISADPIAASGTRVITIYPQGASVVYRILHMPCPILRSHLNSQGSLPVIEHCSFDKTSDMEDSASHTADIRLLPEILSCPSFPNVPEE
ncbi:MAG: hypothetical protein HN617_03230 [Planctomycetaceae bacterium]|nr:hypothetical protein [Planctomycetaceae bacterium]